MGFLRLRARKRLVSKKYPFAGILLLGIVLYGAIYTLEQFTIGEYVNRIALTLHIGDMAAKLWLKAGFAPLWVAAILVVASVFNLFFEVFLIKKILLWSMARQFLEYLSAKGKMLVAYVSAQWRMFAAFMLNILKALKVKKFTTFMSNILKVIMGCAAFFFTGQYDLQPKPEAASSLYPFRKVAAFANHLNGIRKNPSKGGLLTVFVLAATPKVIPGAPGTVPFAVLIISYNKLGWKGWVVLSLAILFRIWYVVFIWKKLT
ncbi:MAG: hypothetical protein WC495_00850 [Patescibacteria group bacterium]|jgi:hypothetical protein